MRLSSVWIPCFVRCCQFYFRHDVAYFTHKGFSLSLFLCLCLSVYCVLRPQKMPQCLNEEKRRRKKGVCCIYAVWLDHRYRQCMPNKMMKKGSDVWRERERDREQSFVKGVGWGGCIHIFLLLQAVVSLSLNLWRKAATSSLLHYAATRVQDGEGWPGLHLP